MMHGRFVDVLHLDTCNLEVSVYRRDVIWLYGRHMFTCISHLAILIALYLCLNEIHRFRIL